MVGVLGTVPSLRNLDTVFFALVHCSAMIAAFDWRHFVDDYYFWGYVRQYGGDVIHVRDDVLELSTGRGAAMAGRAMLAARKICLFRIFVMSDNGRVEVGEAPEYTREDGRQHSSTGAVFVFSWRTIDDLSLRVTGVLAYCSASAISWPTLRSN